MNAEIPAEKNRRLMMNERADGGAAEYANSKLATAVNTSDSPMLICCGN